MEIREVKDKETWEEFVAGQKPHSFLPSWNWGEFNAAMGDKTWRMGIYQPTTNDQQLVGAALVIKITARRGTFLFVPHGMITNDQRPKTNNTEAWNTLIDYLTNLAVQEKCSFIRVSPILKKSGEGGELFKKLGFRRAPMHMHAELLWLLDVTPSEETLLKNMRKTTRYLIKKAQADGVRVVMSDSPEHVLIFNNLYEETARRQRFTAFSRDYLLKEFSAFAQDHQIQVFLAEYNGEFVSGAMIVFYGNAAFYHQGASLNKYPKVAAPYLLQWEIIREVKRRGLEFYNFWGISSDDELNHPWAGLSLFKKGFGGSSEELIPAQDLILSKKYWLTYGIERLRRAKRGL